MRFRLFVAAMLLAGTAQAAGPAPAFDPPTPSVQAMIDKVQAGFHDHCQEAEQKLAAAKPEEAATAVVFRDMACTCVERALNAGFPASMRAGTIPPGAFLARMGGAMNVCVAVTAREQIAAPCDAGVDPFSSASTPEAAKARCSCARAELDRMIAANPAEEADKAAAEYARQGAASGVPSDRDLGPLVFLRHVQSTCAPSTVGNK